MPKLTVDGIEVEDDTPWVAGEATAWAIEDLIHVCRLDMAPYAVAE